MKTYKYFINSDSKSALVVRLNSDEMKLSEDYFDLLKSFRKKFYQQLIMTPSIVKRIFIAFLHANLQVGILEVNGNQGKELTLDNDFEQFNELSEIDNHGQFSHATFVFNGNLDNKITFYSNGIVSLSDSFDDPAACPLEQITRAINAYFA